MRHVLLAVTRPEHALIALVFAAVFVFFFNAYRLGRLKGRTILFFTAVLLAAVIAVFALQNASLQKDKAALCDWLGEMSVVSADADDRYAGKKIILSEGDIAALADALQGLSPESLSEGEVLSSSVDISIFLCTAEGDGLLLKQSGNTVYFTFDEETAARFGDRRFQTEDGALLDAFFDLVD